MTVTYSLNVANAKLTGFSKLLLRWKGSIYKLLYREMLIFLGLYYSLSVSYRYFFTEEQKLIFAKTVKYCRAFTNSIPLVFVLSFYVSIVVTRWWQQFMQIPWPDKAVLLISGYVRGEDERGRIIRRTLARYLILMQVLTFQAVSTSVRRRFPTLDHIQEVGLFTPEERLAYDEIIGTHGKWWVPAQWFTSLVIRARKAGRIKHDYLMDKIIEELHTYRSCCGMMFAYDWISIPLVYTQTVTIATYTYFIATIMAKQYLLDNDDKDKKSEIEYYIPIFTFLEFFFFMGWLKVAEQLINPYGEDDDDFELNWCLDRNLLISYIIVDEMYNKHPKLVADYYWNKREPTLPYTKSSISMKSNSQPHMGSTVNLAVELEDFLPMETIMEEDREDYNYSSPLTTSMADFSNAPNWFNNVQHPFHQTANSTIVNMGSSTNPNYQNQPNTFNNVSRNHSELIDSLKGESNSRSSSRNRLRFLQDLRDSKFLNMILEHSHIQKTNSFNNVNNTNNLASFLLKTPTKRIRTASSMADSINESNKLRSMQTSSNATSNMLALNNSFSMNTSINESTNNLNNAISNTTVATNNLGSFSLSNNNLSRESVTNNNLITSNISNANSTQPNKPKLLPKISLPERESTFNEYKSLKQSKLSKLNQCSPLNHKYTNLLTAPVLPTSSFKTKGMSSLINTLRNSIHFSSENHRNLPRLSRRIKRNSFSSAMSLKSKFNNDNMVSPNGFHFPQNYVPPQNSNQYFPNYFNSEINNSQENSLNKINLNKTTPASTTFQNPSGVEITISPASTSASSKKDLTKNQSLLDINQDKLVDIEDENNKIENEGKFNTIKNNLSIAKAAEILKAFNENDLNNSKTVCNETNISINKLSTQNSDQTDQEKNITLLQNLSNKSSAHSSTSDLSAKSKETLICKTKEDNIENNEEDHYEESPIFSSSSSSPYESNQSTVTSYTQLLEKKF